MYYGSNGFRGPNGDGGSLLFISLWVIGFLAAFILLLYLIG